MTFVFKEQRKLAMAHKTTAKGVGPGSYDHQSLIGGKKRISIREPFQGQVNRQGRNALAKRPTLPAVSQAIGDQKALPPFHGDVVRQKFDDRGTRTTNYAPGPGSYNHPTGFDHIKM